MGEHAVEYNERRIRELMIAAFDDEELMRFCSDHFREVYDRFGSGIGRIRRRGF